MDNELIVHKNWWSNNWKWFLPTFILLFLTVSGFLLNTGIASDVIDMRQAYNDDSLYQNAINKAKTNKRVLEIMGQLKPIDKLAIFEGNTVYSNNNNTISSSVRIQGSKAKGKMDILAKKNGTVWEYKMLIIRIKNPKEEIQIF